MTPENNSMVTIVKTEPHPSVVKEVVCRNCGVTLSYVPNDVVSRYVKDYGGGGDTYKHIKCPNCSKEVGVS